MGITNEVTQVRRAFENKYLDQVDQPFYWDAANATNCKQLIKKVRNTLTYYDRPTDIDTVTSAILKLMDVDDKWISLNMSIKILNSKYNEILNKLKSERNTDIKGAIIRAMESGEIKPS